MVDVRTMLDPELRAVMDAFELPQLDGEALSTMRSTPFPIADLSDAVERTERTVPGDPPVPVRVHRAKGATGAAACRREHPRRRLRPRQLRHGRRALRPLVPAARPRRRVRRVPARARDAVPGSARRLLRRAAVDVRERRRARHRPRPHRDRRGQRGRRAHRGARAAGARPGRGAGRVPDPRLADARRPSDDDVEPGRRDVRVEPRIEHVRLARRTSATCTDPTTCPCTPRPPVRPTSPGSRRRSCASVRSTASGTRTSTTRPG